jgi:hypothetical protein
MKERSMNTKMWLGFLAGAVFVLGLLVTCGNGSTAGGTRTASAGGGTGGDTGGDTGGATSGPPSGAPISGPKVWEYAAYKSFSEGLEVPPTVTAPNISACQTSVCVLNAMGADGWELVALNSNNNYFYFKRAK